MQHINFIHIIRLLAQNNVKNNGFYYANLSLKVHSISVLYTFENFYIRISYVHINLIKKKKKLRASFHGNLKTQVRTRQFLSVIHIFWRKF